MTPSLSNVHERGTLPSIDVMIDRFEAAGHDDGHGDKCWYARDLAVLLGYSRWESFPEVLSKAKAAAQAGGHNPENHFRDVTKLVSVGSGAERPIADVELTRYAAYLTAQNADPRKKPVAIAQTYFAIQTRRQEITDRNGPDFSTLSETQQRLYLRNQVMQHNKKLSSTATGAGVVTSKDHAIFNNKGYQGLYGGRRMDEVRRHKNLPQSAKILDHMGSTELAANLFRITQTEEKLRSRAIVHKEHAFDAHYEVGRKVRQTMLELSGILPENLPIAEDVKKLASSTRTPQKGGELPSASAGQMTQQSKVASTNQPESSRPPVPIDLRADLWKYALLIMAASKGGTICTSDLIAELPKYISIPENQIDANASRKDSRFSQIVRNLKSHKNSSTNFIYRGFAEDIPGGFKITNKGLSFIQTYFSDRRPSSLDERSDRDELEWVATRVGLTPGELAELDWDLQPIDSDGDTFGWMVTFAQDSDRKLLSKIQGLGLGYTVQVGFPPSFEDAVDDIF